jgi:hypothetical protein
MKQLRFSAIITAVLGLLSLLALFFLYLALSDIADNVTAVAMEWRVAGICMMIIGAFIISTFVTLGYILKKANLRDIPQS